MELRALTAYFRRPGNYWRKFNIQAINAPLEEACQTFHLPIDPEICYDNCKQDCVQTKIHRIMPGKRWWFFLFL